MHFDDPVGDGKPQAGTLPQRLGREKGAEKLLDVFRWNATAGVRHLHHHRLAIRREISLDGERASVWHGVGGVVHEIYKDVR